jgi:hypothetical protein
VGEDQHPNQSPTAHTNVIRTGNLALYDEALSQYELFFERHGLYVLLEKLKLIAFRNLIRKMCVRWESPQIVNGELPTKVLSGMRVLDSSSQWAHSVAAVVRCTATNFAQLVPKMIFGESLWYRTSADSPSTHSRSAMPRRMCGLPAARYLVLFVAFVLHFPTFREPRPWCTAMSRKARGPSFLPQLPRAVQKDPWSVGNAVHYG